jgi:hypothetical protein
MREHKFEIDERIKERRMARMKKNGGTKRRLNSKLTGTATLLNKGNTSDILDNPIDNDEENDDYDYVQVDDSGMNDTS